MNQLAPTPRHLPLPRYPGRDLALATYLARFHGTARHNLCASECETWTLAELLALADAEDAARWPELALGYTHPLGAPKLRAAIASAYCIGDGGIMCFSAAQEALYAALHALLSPDDHAIVVLPCYQALETLPMALCAVDAVALDPDRGWSLEIEAVEAAIRPNTRVLIVSFPNNPTGKQLERDRFAALVALCRRHGIWLLSDEVYRLTVRDPALMLPQAADIYERGISIGAMSKAYGLPGLRIGWIACRDRALHARLATIRQYLSTCSAGPSEFLACIALKAADTIIARNHAIAAGNEALLLAFLARHAPLFDMQTPGGGVVGYPLYMGPEGGELFVARMAEQAGVILLPSSVFRSELLGLPASRFRIGFGRSSFAAGLEAFARALA